MYELKQNKKGKWAMYEDDRPLRLSHYTRLQKVLSQVNITEESSEGVRSFVYKNIVSIFTGTPVRDCDKFTYDALELAAAFIMDEVSKSDDSILNESVEWDGVMYKCSPHLIDTDGMTAGQYIDGDNYYRDDDILSLVTTMWQPQGQDKYNGFKESFKDFPFHAAVATVSKFTDYRTAITERFESLYTKSESGTTIGKSNLDLFGESWGWLAKIDALADGNLEKWDVYFGMPIERIMLKIALDTEKQKAISADNKIQERMESVNY